LSYYHKTGLKNQAVSFMSVLDKDILSARLGAQPDAMAHRRRFEFGNAGLKCSI